MPTADEPKSERSRTDPIPARARRRPRWPPSPQRDLLAALTSGFVGALALSASIYNVYLQRVQIRAQVWPHLTLLHSDVDEYTLDLQSDGVGPALVKGARVTVDGKPVTGWNDVYGLLRKNAPDLDALFEREGLRNIHSSFATRVLGAGVLVHPVQFGGLPKKELVPIMREMERVELEICYCSTLGDCWIVDHGITESVSSCPLASLTFQD